MIDTDHLNRLGPAAQARLTPLYDRAEADAGLTATDFYSLRDLLELSGLEQVESLHALLLTMFVALNEGSPCVEVDRQLLALQLADLAGDHSEGWAGQILTDLDGRVLTSLIGNRVEDNKPLVLHQNGPHRFIYFQRFLKHELAAWDLMRQRFDAPNVAVDGQKVRQVLDPPSSILDPRSSILDPRSSILDPRSSILDPRSSILDPRSSPTLDRVAGPTGQPRALNPGQRFALALGLLRPLTIISGGPGTGKTSIVASLLRCLVRMGTAPERIALAAPTGRAAQRLTDALHAGLAHLPEPLDPADTGLKQSDLKATTLHQLLAYSPTSGRFRHHEENPLSCDVLIVDEASMVGLTLLAQLLRALPSDARLVLLGDKDQLPSIEAGSWLAHLIPPSGPPGYRAGLLATIHEIFPALALPPAAPAIPADVVAILRENYRSEPRIQELAAAVNRQDVRLIEQLPRFVLAPASSPPNGLISTLTDAAREGGCWHLEPAGTEPSWLREVLKQWAGLHYLGGQGSPGFQARALACELPADPEALAKCGEQLESLFAVVNGARILTLIREGPWGAGGINRQLAQLVRSPEDRGLLFPGAPVLLTRNDPSRQLFNGDVGLCLRAEGGGLRVVFPRRGGFLSLGVDALPTCELAFALTIHKSQGSEYDQVLLVMPPEGGRHLLTRELVYTGLTRARKLAVLVGPRQRFQEAVARKVQRTSGVIRPSESGEP